LKKDEFIDNDQNNHSITNQEIDLKISNSLEMIDLKLDSKITEFQRKIFEEQAKIFKERLEVLKLLYPSFIAIALAVGGLQLYSKSQFDEFKKEIRGEINEQPILSLFGVDQKPLDGQIIKVSKVFVHHRGSNGAVFAKKYINIILV
jgi:hypothetical protein